jgi:hypothetical protein
VGAQLVHPEFGCGFTPPLSRTVKVPVFRPQARWTPVGRLAWSPRNSQAQLWYWADFSAVLADENDTIQNIAVGLPDTDGGLTLNQYTFVGAFVGILPLAGTLGRSYTILLQPFLTKAGAVTSVTVALPISATPPVIAPPADTVTHRGAVLTIAGISFGTGATS